MIYCKTYIVLSALILLTSNFLQAQDQTKDSGKTVLPNTKMWVEKKDTIPPITVSNTVTRKGYPIGGEIQTSMGLIKQGFTAVFTKPFLDEVIPLDLYFSTKYGGHKIFRVNEPLKIDNCFYNNTSGFNDMIFGGSNDYIFEGHVGFDRFSSNCILFFEKMAFQSGIGISNSNIYKLFFSKCTGNISISNVVFEKNVSIDSSDIQLWLRQIKHSKNDTLKFNVNDSRISLLEINPTVNFETSSLPDLCEFEFKNDSLFGSVRIAESLPKAINKSSIFKFTNCFINSKFNVNNFNGCTLIFENCVFGSSVDMSNISVNSLEFKDCINIPYRFKLRSLNNGSGFITKLKILNSDLSNINFDYAANFKLDFSENEDIQLDENVISVYETLINRFKSEGKLTSYELLKVEYKQYIYSKQGVSGYLKNLLQKYWWYYGFKKSYIIYWTLSFLAIFTIFNYFNWRSMKGTYFSSLDFKKNYYSSLQKLPFQIKKIVSVFLYTSFIFFSLKVDFNEIKQDKTAFLFAFFLQYFTGLICMFFIINAILKFE